MSDALDRFGKLFIKNVRDDSIFYYDGIVSGHMKDEDSKKLYEQLQDLNKKDKTIVRALVINSIDQCLHQFLSIFEENAHVKLIYDFAGVSHNLSEESDGLAGELYTEDGWIEQYSAYKNSME